MIGNRHGIYELPNGIRLRILGNKEISRKSQNFLDSKFSLPLKPKIVNTKKKIWKTEIELFP